MDTKRKRRDPTATKWSRQFDHNVKEAMARLAANLNVLRAYPGLPRNAATSLAFQTWKGYQSLETADLDRLIIENAIQKFRRMSFENFRIRLLVYPAKGSRARYHRHAELGPILGGFDRYTFDMLHNDDPSVDLIICNQQGKLAFKANNDWVPIEAFLEAINKRSIYSMTPEENADTQWDWWKSNGKIFPFMELPPEIRDLVYAHFVEDFVRPYQPDRRFKRCRIGVEGQLVKPYYNPFFYIGNTLVYQEASNLLHLRTTFVIEDALAAQKMLTNIPLLARLRRLRIDVTHRDFDNIFSYSLPPRSRYGWPEDECQTPRLRDLRLEKLEIHIRKPATYGPDGFLFHVCQKVAVDLAFRVAWSSIKGHPFRFTGSLLPDQKTRFEELGEQAKAAFDAYNRVRVAAGGSRVTLRQYDDHVEEMRNDDDGGVHLYGQMDALETEDQLTFPPPDPLTVDLTCHCEPTCIPSAWVSHGS